MSTTKIVGILQSCRQHLNEFALTPLNVEPYRDDLASNCGAAKGMLKELKALESRIVELETKCEATKVFPNKTQYSTFVKEKNVVANTIREFSKGINQSLRLNENVVRNQKRIKIELDIVDDILRLLIKEMLVTGTFTTLRFVQPVVEKEKSFSKMKSVNEHLEELRELSRREHLGHRDSILALKNEIDRMNADLNAIENGIYAPVVERSESMFERRRSAILNEDKKRKSVEEEIEQIKSTMEKDSKVHIETMSTIQKESEDIQRELEIHSDISSKQLSLRNSNLEQMKQERNEHELVLSGLERRWDDEQKQARRNSEDNELKRQLELKKREVEEQEYFASLWIQLRWKAYLKRKSLKKISSKAKGKKKGKKKAI
mmetsp:Transcript_27047/g.57725  ORF Transcript_27047/g.57725 Transcript_27047/m.57725 type:complete len:375 (-) Transcript_27047:1656-2780(-)